MGSGSPRTAGGWRRCWTRRREREQVVRETSICKVAIWSRKEGQSPDRRKRGLPPVPPPNDNGYQTVRTGYFGIILSCVMMTMSSVCACAMRSRSNGSP